MYYLVGLGNPGKEYELSRHNTGRLGLGDFVKGKKMEFNKKLNALVGEVKIGKEKLMIIFPETFMNNSGKVLKPIITSKKRAESLIVIHDDIDLPLGRIKICFAKDSAGHKGVESLIRAIKTKDFVRIRVGISPSTPKGKVKKPEAKKVIDFIISNFKPAELQTIKKVSKKIASAIETIAKEGLGKAMSLYNR